MDANEILSRKEHGEELVLYKSMAGQVRYRFVARPSAKRPRILLVETYRLATYLGAYGAGPVIQTFSLLPGERTKIELRTFRKTEEERQETSSILDSLSEESASDFEETIATEQSDRSGYEESFNYHAEAEASATWGWGRASASGGVKGGTNATREQAAKNTTTATTKHAQKASAKRKIEVSTSHERRETTEQESTTAREIENINVSHTDGVIAEALLGVGDALDAYSSRLQEIEIDQRAASAAKDQAITDREALANEAVRDNDQDRAALLAEARRVHRCDAPLEIAIAQRDGTGHESKG